MRHRLRPLLSNSSFPFTTSVGCASCPIFQLLFPIAFCILSSDGRILHSREQVEVLRAQEAHSFTCGRGDTYRRCALAYDGTLRAMLGTLCQPLKTVRSQELRHYGNIPGHRIRVLKRYYRAHRPRSSRAGGRRTVFRVAMYRPISAVLEVLQVIWKQPGLKGEVLRSTAVVETWKYKPTRLRVGR